MIEKFAVRGMPLHEVLTRLEEASIQADSYHLSTKGVSIVDLTKEPLRSRPLTLSFRNESVRSILDLIADTLNLWILSNGNIIEVWPAESPAGHP
jgi:hypothetical protein